LLFAVAFEMVLGLRARHATQDAEQAVEEHSQDIAAFPLAIPLMAGPGAITATILLAGQAAYRPAWLAVLLAVVVVVMAGCLMAFLAAGRIGKLLGVTGSVVLSRLLGVLLAALAVQYVVDGIRAAFNF
jgi:multiple antibiotic resistance protein